MFKRDYYVTKQEWSAKKQNCLEFTQKFPIETALPKYISIVGLISSEFFYDIRSSFDEVFEIEFTKNFNILKVGNRTLAEILDFNEKHSIVIGYQESELNLEPTLASLNYRFVKLPI